MTIIWITGGKGFIGRHVARFVAANDHRVFGIGHGLWPAQEASKWSYSYWCNGEIDPYNLSQLASVSGAPNVIYHLAGGSSVGASFQSPHEDLIRTVETTAQLLEWVRFNAPACKVIGVSSAAVYGANHQGKIAEDDQVSPYSPYGFHKAMMENLCRSYSQNFGLRICVVRLFSVYGAGLEKQLIWDICCKLAVAENDPVGLDGTGNEVRDWIHVSDAAQLLWLARNECSPDCRVINGGTGIGTKIRDVAEVVCRAWGASPAITFSGKARSGDPRSLVADIARAKQAGFQLTVRVENGIAETVRWFRTYRGKPLSA